MSWSDLNNFELQAMRRILMLDVSEAAELIGKVSNRTWQYWESGRSSVPTDISMEIYALTSQQDEAINGIMSHDEDNQPLRWYHTFDDFQKDYKNGNKVWWKVYQSVVARLFLYGGNTELSSDVLLNKESYIYKFFARMRDEDIEGRA